MYKTGLLSGEDYTDVLIRFSELLTPALGKASDYRLTKVNDSWWILSVKVSELPEVSYEYFGYASVSDLYSLQDYDVLETTGVTSLRNRPGLSLTGAGTIVGIIDTGINYLHEAFCREDGRSRINYLWDQGEDIVYDNVDIDEALKMYREGGNPYSIVNEKDSGHGTFLAGISAGGEFQDKNFSGVAPECEIAVVKLREAKSYLRSFYLAENKDIPLYSEVDIILALKELNDYAERKGMPISIILGLGENLGSHDGSSVLSQVLDMISGTVGRCVCVAAGNMADRRQHFYYGGENEAQAETLPYVEMEINVESTKGFMLSIWSAPPYTYTVGILSPEGTYSERIVKRQGSEDGASRKNVVNFPLSGGKVEVFYGINEAVFGQNYGVLRFVNPSAGVWSVRVFSDNPGSFNAWIADYEGKARFLSPDPFTTVTEPGNSYSVITVGSYNNVNGAPNPKSGRGNSFSGRIEPDIVAPGDEVMVPSNVVNDGYVTASGTSIAAAVAGGVSALMLEYGIVRGKRPYMRVYTIKNIFIENATRDNYRIYPNPVIGWGYLNL